MANEMRDAIKGNPIEDIRAVAIAGDAALAAAILDIAGAGRTYETVKVNAADIATVKGANWTSSMTLKAHDDTINGHTTAINALERSGSTITVAGTDADAARAITLTIKDGDGTAVSRYAMIGVKVTLGNGSGVDTGNPAVIATGLTTVDGLTVTTGEQLSPSNGAAISDTKNASLIAYSNASGVLAVTAKTAVNNTYIFVHFIMPDGTVKKSAEIKLKEV